MPRRELTFTANSARVLGQESNAHPDSDFTTQDAARDLQKHGDIHSASDMLAGAPEPLGRADLPAKRKPGRPRGRTFDEKVTFTIESDLLAQVDELADALHTSRAAVIRDSLRSAVARERAGQ